MKKPCWNIDVFVGSNVVDKHMNVFMAFRSAASFELAAQQLRHELHVLFARGEQNDTVNAEINARAIPYAVNHAFSTELYLKCFLTLDGTPDRTRHNLKELYDTLNERRRSRLQQLYVELLDTYDITQAGISSMKEYGQLISIHSDVFERWRYLYEIPEGNSGAPGEVRARYHVKTFPFAIPLRKALVEALPEFASHCPIELVKLEE